MGHLRKPVLGAALALLAFGAARAQDPKDANQVINEYLKASGGKKAIAKVQTLSLDGNIVTSSDANSAQPASASITTGSSADPASNSPF